MGNVVAVSGSGLGFPSWGRAFWQDPNDGQLICLYASGTSEINYITSSDFGVTWSAPTYAFPIDDFSTHNNFDTTMDRDGNVHCVHRYNGSGCYSLLGKVAVSGGWTPSGVVARGFFTCRSTVAAREFNGSIEVYDQNPSQSFPAPGGTSFPSAFITAVDSSSNVGFWYVNSPYASTPTLQSVISTADVGPSGGFPVHVGGAGTGGTVAVSFYIQGTGISIRNFFFAWGDLSQGGPTYLSVNPDISESDPDRLRGWVVDAPYSPNMAYCRVHDLGGPGDATYFMLTNVSGIFELIGTAVEEGRANTGPWVGRMDSLAGTSGQIFDDGEIIRRLIPDDYTFKDFIGGLAGGDSQIAGTPVDISYYDAPVAFRPQSPAPSFRPSKPHIANVNFYFLQRKLNGNQVILRIKGEYQASDRTDGGTQTLLTLTDLWDSEYGIKEFGETFKSNAGAGTTYPNRLHWDGIKALRTPVPPGSGVTVNELVSVIGRGIDGGAPETNSFIYMVTPDDTPAGAIPTYVTELTTQSGALFSGIHAVAGMTNPSNLFDSNTATSGQVSNSGNITLAFDEVVSVGRVEVLWNSPPNSFWGIDIESSYDDVTYENVYSLPSGTPGASPSLIKISAEYDPFAPNDPTVTARMDAFTGKYVKLSFFGDDAQPRDVREIKLYGIDSTAGFISTSGWLSQLVNSTREDFRTTTTGVPQGWSTYGDWTWSVEKGSHQSGVLWTGERIGNGDISAIRTQRDSPINSTGVLEVDVNITSPKVISFDLQLDLQANINSIIDPNEPTDDYLFLYLITPTGTIDLSDIMYQQTIIPREWRTISFFASDLGINTIRWVYKRGNKLPGEGQSNAEAAAWIDNVQGLDPQPGSPNLLATIWGYIGGPEAREEINAYTNAADVASGEFYGYMDTVSGLPNDIINAYHAGEFAATGLINAYTAATQEFGEAYGFMEGFVDTPSETVFGYMFTSGAFDLLYGHMQNKLNESINGFMLAPSGAFNSINAYIATPQFLAVNGYVKVTEEDVVQVNAYLKANGFGDQINGYMFASGLNNTSYGYIKADGVAGQVYSYMKSLQFEDIAGYIQGASGVSGVINSWISGVAVASEAINAFMPAISGDIDENINGFIGGLDVPDDRINGYLVGFGDDGQCNFPVPNPPFVASPTGNFFN